MAIIDRPNYSFQGQVPSSAIIDAYQKKAMAEQDSRDKYQLAQEQKMVDTAKMVQTGADLINKFTEQSKQKQMEDARNAMVSLLSQQNEPYNNATGTGTIPYSQTPQYKQELSGLIAKASPDTYYKEVAEQAAKSVMPPQTPTEFSTHQVMLNGQPTMLNYAKNGQWYDQNRQPVQGEVKPFSTNVDSPLTDEDRKRLYPLAKAVVEGRGVPQAFVNPRSPDKAKISLLASEIDPQFDLSKASQRVALRTEYVKGNAARNLTSLNTVIPHMDTLQKAADALNNRSLRKYNSVSNYLKNETGKPEVVRFEAAKNAVNNELGRVFQGVGAITDAEREAFNKDLGAANSPEQIQGVIDTYIDLIKSRTDAIRMNWEQSMGDQASPTPFLNSKVKKILQSHGYDATTMEKTGESGGWTKTTNGVSWRIKK